MNHTDFCGLFVTSMIANPMWLNAKVPYARSPFGLHHVEGVFHDAVAWVSYDCSASWSWMNPWPLSAAKTAGGSNINHAAIQATKPQNSSDINIAYKYNINIQYKSSCKEQFRTQRPFVAEDPSLDLRTSSLRTLNWTENNLSCWFILQFVDHSRWYDYRKYLTTGQKISHPLRLNQHQ